MQFKSKGSRNEMVEFVKKVEDEKFLQVWNNYMSYLGESEDYVFLMKDIGELCDVRGWDVITLIQATRDEEFEIMAKYVKYDVVAGLLKSSDELEAFIDFDVIGEMLDTLPDFLLPNWFHDELFRRSFATIDIYYGSSSSWSYITQMVNNIEKEYGVKVFEVSRKYPNTIRLTTERSDSIPTFGEIDMAMEKIKFDYVPF